MCTIIPTVNPDTPPMHTIIQKVFTHAYNLYTVIRQVLSTIKINPSFSGNSHTNTTFKLTKFEPDLFYQPQLFFETINNEVVLTFALIIISLLTEF